MNREEAIQILTRERDEDIFGGYTLHRKKIHEAETMAIEALKGEQLDEWCTDCKEYDTEKKCCPRFNRVIRGAMKREPSEDLISRTEATEIFEAMLKTVTDQKIKIGISRSWQQIKDLPSADRPRGYWIGDKCSVCGEERAWYGSNPPICPDCGAKMDGERSEE